MDPHKPEMHASGFQAILEVASQELGEEALDQIVAELGVTREALSDQNAWFSLEFAEALVEAVNDGTGDPSWLDRAMRLGLSPRYMGVLYPLFRSFGTPAFTYRQVSNIVQRLNKVSTWTTEEVGPEYARIAVRGIEGASRETTMTLCRVRSVQLPAVATLFDLPPAELEHPSCMMRGDEACVYELRWKGHRRPIWSWLGLAGGASLGAATSAWALSGVGALALPLLLGVGGWSLGRAIELRRDLRNRIEDLHDSHDALTRSTRAHEERFKELQAAKSEVEKRVERRTAELQQTSQRLAETLREVEGLSRTKDEFFNNVSHELRTPLTLILAPIEDLLANREPPGGTEAALRAMNRNARRLLTLISQVLDLAKIDAGEARIRREPTDLVALANATAEAFQSDAVRRGVRLRVHAPREIPSCDLDRAWIESALTNLIANALRFVDSGGSIDLSLERAPEGVVVRVADNGAGIAPADQALVFERFAQASGTRSREGTGLGLAIVREAARLHGGQARVESEPGKGTTFTITLPGVLTSHTGSTPPPRLPQTGSQQAAPQAPEQAVQDAAAAPLPGMARGAPHAALAVPAAERPIVREEAIDGPSVEAPLALLVEDNDDLRAYMAGVLATDYRVQTAADGARGLELAWELRPDVVVSDVAMPGKDGYALCRALRGDERTRNTPVILVTAGGGTARVLEGFEAGAGDYLLKPFQAQELLARVGVHVRLQRAMREMAEHERLVTLGSLAASVAHQVRNPLTTLVSGLPAMQRRLGDKLDEPSREMLAVMVDCAHRIERMTVDLLDVSRIDREQTARFAPGQGLLSAARLLEARASDLSLRIESDGVDRGTELHGRPGDMNHAFLNLIDNALEAAGTRGTVRVSGGVEGGSYVVRVEDSGPGVPPDLSARIFEPFFTTRPSGKGTGLGLAIVQRIAQQHGGRIDIGRSSLGGACFTVSLPLDHAAVDDEAAAGQGTAAISVWP